MGGPGTAARLPGVPIRLLNLGLTFGGTGFEPTPLEEESSANFSFSHFFFFFFFKRTQLEGEPTSNGHLRPTGRWSAAVQSGARNGGARAGGSLRFCAAVL